MKNDIKQTWQLEHPVETVWAYLTDTTLLAQWLMENDFKSEVGQTFQFRTKAVTRFGFDGNIYCKVLAIIPFQKISYTWQGGPGNGKITLDSIVTWTLTPHPEGCTLILEHTGFKGIRNFPGYFFMNLGWKKKIKKRLLEFLKLKTAI